MENVTSSKGAAGAMGYKGATAGATVDSMRNSASASAKPASAPGNELPETETAPGTIPGVTGGRMDEPAEDAGATLSSKAKSAAAAVAGKASGLATAAKVKAEEFFDTDFDGDGSIGEPGARSDRDPSGASGRDSREDRVPAVA